MKDNLLKIKAYLLDQVFLAKLISSTKFKMSGSINGMGAEDFVAQAIQDVLIGQRNPKKEDVQTERKAYFYMLGVIKSLISNARTSLEGKTKHVQDSSDFERVSDFDTEESFIKKEDEQLAVDKINQIRAELVGDELSLSCMDHLLDVIGEDVYEVNKTLAKTMKLPINEIVACRRKITRTALKLGSI